MIREGVITALQMAPTALRVNIMEPARAEAEQKRRLTHLLPGGGLPRPNNGREKKKKHYLLSPLTHFLLQTDKPNPHRRTLAVHSETNPHLDNGFLAVSLPVNNV